MLVNTWGTVNSWIASAILNNEIIGDEMGYKKGVAVANFSFGMLDADNQPVTTGTTTGQMTVNGVTSATLANASYTGSNMWNISFTDNEMNGDDQVVFTPINSSAVVNPRTLKVDSKVVSDLNDIDATDVVTDGAINTSDGIASSDIKKINDVTITGAGGNPPFNV